MKLTATFVIFLAQDAFASKARHGRRNSHAPTPARRKQSHHRSYTQAYFPDEGTYHDRNSPFRKLNDVFTDLKHAGNISKTAPLYRKYSERKQQADDNMQHRERQMEQGIKPDGKTYIPDCKAVKRQNKFEKARIVAEEQQRTFEIEQKTSRSLARYRQLRRKCNKKKFPAEFSLEEAKIEVGFFDFISSKDGQLCPNEYQSLTEKHIHRIAPKITSKTGVVNGAVSTDDICHYRAAIKLQKYKKGEEIPKKNSHKKARLLLVYQKQTDPVTHVESQGWRLWLRITVTKTYGPKEEEIVDAFGDGKCTFVKDSACAVTYQIPFETVPSSPTTLKFSAKNVPIGEDDDRKLTVTIRKSMLEK